MPARAASNEQDAGTDQPVVITGMGVVCPIGSTLDAFARALELGRDGMKVQKRFGTREFAGIHAALLTDERWQRALDEHSPAADPDPCATLALEAARQAWHDARLESAPVSAHRIAIVLGTSTGGLFSRSRYEHTPRGERSRRHQLLARSGFHVQTAAVAEALGTRGPRVTLSTACTSSTHAIAHARDLLRAGAADVVLAGGADLVVEEVLAGFHAMGAICPEPCAPFSDPVGMTLGEGAAFIALELAGHAAKRGVVPRAELLGAGFSADAHHATAPDPTGAGIARALVLALRDAGVRAANIGHFNAHGTGTDSNDVAEWRALCRVFGDAAATLPITAPKSYFGHALGAAGVLELVVSVLALERRSLPPTLHYRGPRGHEFPKLSQSHAPLLEEHALALTSNSAFGGVNATLVVGRPPRASVSRQREERVVAVGVGAIAAHGTDGLDRALRGGSTFWSPEGAPDGLELPSHAARVPSAALDELSRGFDVRGMDATARLLTAAAVLALRDSGLKLRGTLRDRTGLFVGGYRLPWDSADEFWDSIRQRGFARASAPAFSRIVMNGAAGAVSRALGIRGPLSVLANGPGAALVATALAKEMLGREHHADVLLVAAASAIGPGSLADHAFRFPASVRAKSEPFPVYGDFHYERPVPGEGGACVVLVREQDAKKLELSPIARLAGWGLAGPDALGDAIRQALAGASVEREEVDAVYGCADGSGEAGRRELSGITQALGAALGSIALFDPAPLLGSADSLDVLSLAAALHALRSGRAHALPEGAGPTHAARRPVRRVLVVASDAQSGSTALLFDAS